MVNRILLAAVLALGGLGLSLAPVPAWALTLDQARAAGQVGEQPDGYIGVVSGGADVADLVARVNLQRKAAYADIAAKNGTSVDAVGAVTAEQIINRLPKGAYFLSGTAWVQK